MALCSLSLFSGGGGLDLAVRLAVRSSRTVCYVEGDIQAADLLAARMETGDLDQAPVWSDVRTFDGHPWRGAVDLVVGGFPCQDISLAGRGAGIEGERSGLWGEYARIIRDVEPRLVFVENVAALAGRGLDRVLGDLADLGFNAEWTCLRASEVGAPHQRNRIFILAYADTERERQPGGPIGAIGGRVADSGQSVAHPDRIGHDTGRGYISEGQLDPSGCGEELGDASGERRGEGRAGADVRGGRDTAAGTGGELGNADSTGREGYPETHEGGGGVCQQTRSTGRHRTRLATRVRRPGGTIYSQT